MTLVVSSPRLVKKILLLQLLICIVLLKWTTFSPRRCEAFGLTGVRREAIHSTSFLPLMDGTNMNEADVAKGSCSYAGDVVFSHPLSINVNDRFYFLGRGMLAAVHLTVDKINEWPRCGLTLDDGTNYALTVQTYGDQSNGNLTAQIGQAIIDDSTTDFIMAGFGSTLSAYLTPVVAEHSHVIVTSTSADPKVHAVGESVFGVVPPSSICLNSLFEGMHSKGANTVAFIAHEEANLCNYAPSVSEKFGLELVSGVKIPEDSPFDAYVDLAKDMAKIDPDVMLICMAEAGFQFTTALRQVDWTPKAMVWAGGYGNKLETALGSDIAYMMGINSWDQGIQQIPDPATGMTPSDFYQLFSKFGGEEATSVMAATSASVSVLAQAIERVGKYRPTSGNNVDSNSTLQSTILNGLSNFLPSNSETDNTWQTLVQRELANGFFPTVYGNISFSGSGQSSKPFLVLQYNKNYSAQVHFPVETKSLEVDLVYPMPTWKNRDCELLSRCSRDKGTCTMDGYCDCPAPTISNGRGETAECIPFHGENESSRNQQYATPIIALILVSAATLLFIQHRRNRHPNIWQVKKTELAFAYPPVVLGRGSFGLVLLAEYRGTQVAVKRVLPTSAASRGGSMDSSFSDETTTQCQSVVGITSSVNKSELGSASSSSIRGGSHAFKRKTFVREMGQLAKLRHPCITTVMGAVLTDDPLLVMELMQHGSLRDLLSNQSMVLEGELLLPILQDITSGCRFLHAANPQIVHGDLKAANILVDSRFRAKVADFGLTQKKRKSFTGTPYWMAPELLRMESSNSTATDVYSFGIIVFEAYSRQEPYEGEDSKEVLQLIKDKAINKRPPVPKDCPAQMASIMCDCLVEDPTGRPSFEELDNRLGRIDAKDALPTSEPKDKQVSLNDIFPKHIAEALKNGRKVEPENRDSVTIFFSDIVGFTNISSSLSAIKVANMLDRLYLAFDRLSEEHDVFKVETIGDAYMAVTNLVKDQGTDHVRRIADFAVDAIEAANQVLVDEDKPDLGYVTIRVGFHTGPIVASVVGSRNPRYCLFGDTVNTASRMESNSSPGRIMCSNASATLLNMQSCTHPIVCRGVIQIKGKGEMETFWVGGNGEQEQEQAPTAAEKKTLGRNRNSKSFRAGDSSRSFGQHQQRTQTPCRRTWS